MGTLPIRQYANGQYLANSFVEGGTQVSSALLMKMYANGTAQILSMYETGGVSGGTAPSLGNDTNTSSGSVNTLNGTYPTGISAGDLLVLWALQNDTGATTITSWPSGFTEIASSPVAEPTEFAIALRVATKTATGTESGTYTINWSQFEGADIGMIDIKGVNPSPIDAQVTFQGGDPFGTTNTLTGTSISPTNAGECILFFGLAGSAGTAATGVFTPPTGLSSSRLSPIGGNDGVGFFYAIGIQAAAGAHTYSGSIVWTAGDSRDHLGYTIALTVPAPPPVGIKLFANGQMQVNTYSEI